MNPIELLREGGLALAGIWLLAAALAVAIVLAAMYLTRMR